jgi:hypothetical protein
MAESNPIKPMVHGESPDVLSFRDMFAMHALTGILLESGSDTDDAILARRCYEIADAMVKERQRRHQ